MRIEFSVDGLDEVVDALDELSEELLLAAIAEGMREGTEEMARVAQKNAPHGDTGKLADSISADEPKVSGTTVTGGATAHSEYAIYVEMGAGPVGAANPHPSDIPVQYSTSGWVYPTKDGEFRYTEGQPAKSFMYKAYQQEKDNVVKTIAGAVKEVVER